MKIRDTGDLLVKKTERHKWASVDTLACPVPLVSLPGIWLNGTKSPGHSSDLHTEVLAGSLLVPQSPGALWASVSPCVNGTRVANELRTVGASTWSCTVTQMPQGIHASGGRLPLHHPLDLVQTLAMYFRSCPRSDRGHSFALIFNKYVLSTCWPGARSEGEQADRNACSRACGAARTPPEGMPEGTTTLEDSLAALNP